MTLGTKSLLALSVCAALGSACKKKATEATGSGSAGTGTAAASIDAAAASIDAAPVSIDAAVAAVEPAQAPPAASNVPPELQALDATIKPILAMSDEDARTKAACKAEATIRRQIATVGDHPPAGVDATAWRELSERVAGGLDEFAIECGEGSASSTKALAEAAETAKEFLVMLAPKPN